jgi:hypothetical protein
MLQVAASVLDLPFDVHPDPDEFIQSAMEWHFSPQTGSPFWLERAKSLDFDPRTDVKSFEDLTLFPNVTNELRDVRAQDLIPQGYGPRPEVVGVFESGGTTGAPKRIVVLREWWDRMLAWQVAHLDARGVPRNGNWLVLIPSGPHMAGEMMRRQAAALGGMSFTIDMDPPPHRARSARRHATAARLPGARRARRRGLSALRARGTQGAVVPCGAGPDGRRG